jgi:6,7-dimethyl-8-ribityllumazine synthase
VKDIPTIAGADDATALRVGVVVSVYHEAVTDALRRGAVEALVQAGALADRIVVIRVPGAFEVPFAARRAAETRQFDALVCLGCIIRGETPQFNYLASAVAHGVGTASQETGVPISFGVLTTDTYEEAVARAGDGNDNKGWEAAMAAVQLANVVRSLNRDNRDRRGHDE